MKRTVLVLSALVLFLASCGTKAQKETFREGTDTQCTADDFRSLAGTDGYFLSPGDRIAVISPSSLPSTEQRDAVMKGLKDLGYEPVEGKHTVGETRTLEEAAEDLRWALADPEIKAIFCIRGGTASSEVLDYLGLDVIRANPKLIIGFSDITTFLSAWTSCGLLSLHSPMSGTFLSFSEESRDVQLRMMQGEIPTYRLEGNSHNRNGKAEGILIGGNLSVLLSVLGTPSDPTVTGEPYILFLEDVEEDLEHLHRYLTVLKHLGVLDRAEGIVFGEWTDIPSECKTFSGSSRGGAFAGVADMIDRQFLSELDCPVAFGFPAGHSDVHYPLLMGRKAELSVEEDGCTLSWE
jgi:muramoyltetrapeptide carboxypeptidase